MKKKGIIIGAAALAAIGIGAGAYVALNAKDPKETVIQAFEQVYEEGQRNPVNELFGITQFVENKEADLETGVFAQLDSCSDETVNAYAGMGLRLGGMDDKTNGKAALNAALVYNGMDLANLDLYGEDRMLMAACPELVSEVFTLDLGEGLAERLQASPVAGPLLEESGVDVEGIASYLDELLEEAEKQKEEGRKPFDFKALMDRYEGGCMAKDNFKEALTVEKAEKATYTVDGKEETCQGYLVTASKDSMMDFLRTSADFFLQDEMLKEDFLRQLEATVKMSEFMSMSMDMGAGGGASSGTAMSAEELQEEQYDKMKESADDMIHYLDKTLNDLHMTVYVTRKGRLAAFSGNMDLNAEENAGGEAKTVAASFDCLLQGGAYPAQNVTAKLKLERAGDTMSWDLLRQGTYDGKTLTADLSLDAALPGGNYNFVYTGTYASEGGSFHVGAELGSDGAQLGKLSLTGVVDELEKGKVFHATVDSLEVSAMDNSTNMALSGEYYWRPLSSEVKEPDGKAMDVLAATQEDWDRVAREALLGVMGIASQMGDLMK